MTLYVDSSAFAKRYFVAEHDRDEAVAATAADLDWVSSELLSLEVERAIRIGIDRSDVDEALASYREDHAHVTLIRADAMVLSVALEIAAETGIKSLDAIHVASAALHDDRSLRFLTFDKQQAAAAVDVGLKLAR